MSEIKEVAILIVGAGPAGISTTLHLAQLAPHLIPDILVLERSSHPRPKLCAGGILPDGEVLLEALGLDITEIPHVDVDQVHFQFAARGISLRPDPSLPYAFRTVRRHEFDAWLAGKARERGIQVLEQTNVLQVEFLPDRVVLHTQCCVYHAKVVVAADGAASRLRRAIVPREPLRLARLLEIIAPPAASTSPHAGMDAFFEFRPLLGGIPGYVWDFPAVESGQPVRTLGIYDSNLHRLPTARPLRPSLQAELHPLGIDLDLFPPGGAPLRWFDPQARFSAARLLLVGDAAGSDGLLGEGISFALGYGALAASAIQQAFSSGDFSFRGYRRALLRSQMGQALCWRRFFARVYYRLRSARLQALIWHRLGGWVVWIARLCLVGWARREKKRTG